MCATYFKEKAPLCNSCKELLKTITACCPICALPYNAPSSLPCSQCQDHRPHFDRVLCSYVYEEPLRTLIHHFKYHGGLFLRRYFAQLMLKSLEDLSPLELGCLVPVPMHPKKLQQRGFNHAAILTKILARQLSIPYDLNLCTKLINTQSQAQLSRTERQQTIRGSFRSRPHAYPTITLVDDLLTTGSTANELAGLIKQQAPCNVNIWCLARTADCN